MNRKRNKVLIAVIVISALVCLTACGILIFRYIQMRLAAEDYSNLQSSSPQTEPVSVDTDADDGLLPESVLPDDFLSLMDVNPEVYAWITIPETNVNYPVLQSSEDDNFYLNHNVYKNYSFPERFIPSPATSLTGATESRCCTGTICLTVLCLPHCTNLKTNPSLKKTHIFTYTLPTES